jgi:hypothetical protein
MVKIYGSKHKFTVLMNMYVLHLEDKIPDDGSLDLRVDRSTELF